MSEAPSFFSTQERMAARLASDSFSIGLLRVKRASSPSTEGSMTTRSGRCVVTLRYMKSSTGTMTDLPWSCPST